MNRTKHMNRGEAHGLSKLFNEEIKEIRRRRRAGDRTQDIADDFKLSQRYIYDIVSKKAWKHI